MRSVLVFGFFAMIGFTCAQSKEKPPFSARDYSKEAFIVEKLQKRIIEQSDGSGSREVNAEIKILADAGVKAFAVLTFTYTSANEEVDIDYIRVRKPDGTVVKTPDYNLQDMPAEVSRTAPLYSDIHERHAAVKGLGVGDVLEYLVRYRVVKPQIPGHFWYEDSFITAAIVKDERLEISVPRDKYVKVVSPDFKPEIIDDDKARRVYRWTHSNLEVKERDPNETPRRTPPNPSVQVTTFASWEEIGRWYDGLQRDSEAVTRSIQSKANELTKDLKTDDDKIRALYNFVSLHFHYIGLDFGIGRFQPHAAEDVLENGYGDCKDKHTLLAALLKATGHDAWPVLIHSRRKLDPDVPSPAQFDHVITVVPIGDELVWLDTTSEVAPYGLLLTELRNKQGLMIPPNKPATLHETPENAPFQQDQEFSAEGKLDSAGTFTGHIKQSYRGDSEVVLRNLFRRVAQSQWKETIQNLSYRLGFMGEVSNVQVSPPEDTNKSFELSYDYVRKDYGDWEHKQIIAPLPPMGLEVAKGSDEKKPLEPVLLGGVGKIFYRSRLDLPPSYSISEPQPVNLVEPYAEYHASNVFLDGTLTTTRQFLIKRTEVPLSEWQEYRNFRTQVGDDEFNFIPLSRKRVAKEGTDASEGDDVDEKFREGTEALKKGDIKRAQELFERVIKIEPKHNGAQLQLGMTFFAQNRYEDALAAFRKEEETSPQDMRSYFAAASVAKMMDRTDESMQEFRKLLKEDPGNQDAAINLEQMLYEAGKYAESVAVLEEALKASPESSRLHYATGLAYLKTGDTEKAIANFRAALKGQPEDPTLLNDIAYTLARNKLNLSFAKECAEQAMKELEARSRDEVRMNSDAEITHQLSQVWDTLGWISFVSGDTDRSESLVHAAWLLGQDPVVGEHLGEICEKQGKRREAAHVYELALAAQSSGPLRLPASPASFRSYASPIIEAQLQDEEIRARYKKLTGRNPVINESRRLPNGEWTKTPAEQLSQMRTTKLGRFPKALGSAEFSITFHAAGIQSVKFVRGEKALESLTDSLKTAHYQVEFPTGSQASIVRRGQVSCTESAGCMVVLMPVFEPHTGAYAVPH